MHANRSLRNTNRRSFLKLLGAAGAGLAGARGANAQAAKGSITIRTSSVQVRTQEVFLLMERWGAELTRRSNGVVNVVISGPEAVPGGEKDSLEGLKTTRVYDVIQATTLILSTLDPRFGLTDLPFIFKDVEQGTRALDGPVGKALDEMLIAKAGIRPLMRTYDLMRQVNLKTKPIREVTDFKGVKIRTVQAELAVRAFRLLGANPVPMNPAELYTAIQTGVIDGWESPLDALVARKTYEVANYVSLTNHMFADVTLCMEESFYRKLPKDIQDLVMSVSLDLLADHRKRMAETEKEAKTTLDKAGVKFNEIADKTRFQNAVAQVYNEFGKQHGILNLVNQARSA